MKAVLHQRRSMVLKLVTECTFTINLPDSLGRTVLHYAYLFMDDPEMIILLQRCGARTDLTDVCGRLPRDYSTLSCGVDEHRRLQREVLDADLDIYTYRTDFENSFRAAIKAADLPLVEHLIAGLSRHGDVARYSQFLFDCVDLCREDIAIFLLKSGFRTDIWRQNPLCINQIPVCASRECGHSMVSLKQRAVETGCTRVSKLINALTVDTVS
ncbi:unnamed protein product [Lymnaea stagnalis]|uniref:Ankyrin repeat protein n=1 Tax=Lymnaea stagnalis TaxID=6523 RepID=A0AAV2HD87_LYMST